MDVKRIRDESIRTARQLGEDVPITLPLLDATLEMRGNDEIVSRILTLHAVAATAYGLENAKAVAWLEQEHLGDWLTDQERRFVYEGVGQPNAFHVQVEGMWALAWASGIVQEMNFGRDCDNRFAAMLPNLKVSQSSAAFRQKASPRSLEQVVAACDLAYCLHWVIRQAELTGKRPSETLKPYVVIERRRALEWMLSTEAWDEVSRDT